MNSVLSDIITTKIVRFFFIYRRLNFMACPSLSTEMYQLCIEITAEIKLGNDVVSYEITSTAIFNVLRIAHCHFACRFLRCLITTREGSLRETNDETPFRILCETSIRRRKLPAPWICIFEICRMHMQ